MSLIRLRSESIQNCHFTVTQYKQTQLNVILVTHFDSWTRQYGCRSQAWSRTATVEGCSGPKDISTRQTRTPMCLENDVKT